MQVIEGIKALGTQDGEEGVSETGKHDVAIPTLKRAEFIIGEADLLFGHFEGLFGPPAGTSDVDKLGEDRVGGEKQR